MMLRPYGVRNPKRENGVQQFTGLSAVNRIASQDMAIPLGYCSIVTGPYDAMGFTLTVAGILQVL